jgi:hypothetical protein
MTLALYKSAVADAPTVKFESLVWTRLAYTDGIEVTRGRFAPRNFAVEVGALVGAFYDAVAVGNVGTLVVWGDGRIKVAGIVNNAKALLLDGSAVFLGEITFHLWVKLFEDWHLIGVERRTEVALHAATALAHRKVAHKVLEKNVLVY